MKLSKIAFKGENRIRVDFPYDQQLSMKVKMIPGAQWSKSENAWHIPDNQESIDLLKENFGTLLNGTIQNIEKTKASFNTQSSISSTNTSFLTNTVMHFRIRQ